MAGKRSGSGIWLAATALCVCAALGVVRYSYLASEPASVPPAAPSQLASDEDHPKLTLDEDQRQYLWQVEHHGNVLSRHGFQRLAEALRQADERTLAGLLAPGFSGQVLEQPREIRLDTDFAQVVRQEDAGHPPAHFDAAQFIARLLDFRRRFTQLPKVKLSLMALAPTVPENLDSIWHGSCLLRMWGEMGAGRPGEVTLRLEYETLRPQEDALQQGGWLLACAISQSLVAQATHFLMCEVAAERGIDARRFHDNWTTKDVKDLLPSSGGVYVCDFDRDGILDIFITDPQVYALYKGLPDGKFRDVTAEVGLPMPATLGLMPIAAAFVDVDGDGWEDLILGDGRLFRNEAGKRFTEVTHLSNLRLPEDAGGIIAADYDRDGRVDLYVTRASSRRHSSYLETKTGPAKGNQLWRNKGGWQFENVTGSSGTVGGGRSSFTAVWLDANNDGWPDLYVINEFGAGVLLLNNGDGTFREQLLVAGPGDFGSMGLTCGDIDNDGNIDLYVANMYSKAGKRVIGNLRPGTYREKVMSQMRQFVAGSQLWRNLGPRSQKSEVRGQKSEVNSQALTADLRPLTSDLRPLTSDLTPIFEPLGERYQVADIGWSYGAALADLDNDGWLDLYATAGFMSRSRSEPDG
jgi:hypothetical protein